MAVKVDTPPVIDGIMDDEVWNLAPKCSPFVQDDPVPVSYTHLTLPTNREV